MVKLSENRWGKSGVRISKIHRSDHEDSISDLTLQILLEGDVEPAHIEGDNRSVLPTDTMRNTVYCLAQDSLTDDREAFAGLLCEHFLSRDDVTRAEVSISERLWSRSGPTGFIGGGSETRTATVAQGSGETGIWAGIEGLFCLKTTGSAFVGFPRDQFTVLPEAEDRILATSVTAIWRYSNCPSDTTATWEMARSILLESFFGEWSASVQHQGWLMGTALLDAIPEMEEIDLHMPNQHHLPFDLSRFGMEHKGTVFQPVSEPYGDIGLTVTR